jgi:hypothetical protein
MVNVLLANLQDTVSSKSCNGRHTSFQIYTIVSLKVVTILFGANQNFFQKLQWETYSPPNLNNSISKTWDNTFGATQSFFLKKSHKGKHTPCQIWTIVSFKVVTILFGATLKEFLLKLQCETYSLPNLNNSLFQNLWQYSLAQERVSFKVAMWDILPAKFEQ